MRAMALRMGVAGILFVLTSGAHAALVEREDAEVRTMEADRSGKILPPKSRLHSGHRRANTEC
jgi:hypothetical protein